MIPHEVGLNPGGLLNSVSQVINQVTSDMNPNNYPYNVVGSIPAFQPNVTSGPLGNGGYNRFNEVEKKERETAAEDWISALLRKKLESKRNSSAIMNKVIKKEMFLYEFAM